MIVGVGLRPPLFGLKLELTLLRRIKLSAKWWDQSTGRVGLGKGQLGSVFASSPLWRLALSANPSTALLKIRTTHTNRSTKFSIVPSRLSQRQHVAPRERWDPNSTYDVALEEWSSPTISCSYKYEINEHIFARYNMWSYLTVYFCSKLANPCFHLSI